MTEIVERVQHIDNVLDLEELFVPTDPQLPADGSLEFEGVSFSHGEEEVLHNISFRIEPGQLVALVGPSGDGKNTIVHLAARFWDIKQGTIRLGGIDIRNILIHDLMGSIAFVFQETYIFRDSVENNIRMGNHEASLDEVRRAAQSAQAEEFILQLPNGYETVLGEKSIHLSGGEKQRIALARVMLKNPSVIILDEATAHADAENESKIQAAFAELTRGKTVLVIAHNLPSIQDADCILVVNEGQITERGTHEQLMALGGLYRNMVELHGRAQNWALEVTSDDGNIE
jgi:ATP-binding cassette subfamily B protein